MARDLNFIKKNIQYPYLILKMRIIHFDISSCSQRGEERLEKTRQMELQLPEQSYVIVPSFLLFCM